MSIRGIDISHYQNEAGKIDWDKLKDSAYKFCFVKCTEGINYRDPFYERNKDGVRDAGLLFGAYHFARLNDPIKEADHFCDNVGDLKEGEIVILDFEVDGHKDPVGLCLAWLKRVEERLGFKPLLYTNEARVKALNWDRVVKNNNGLWIARFYLNTGYLGLLRPSSGQWPFWVLFQYTSRGTVQGIKGNVDLNYGNIDIETLMKYGKKRSQTQTCLHCSITGHCPTV